MNRTILPNSNLNEAFKMSYVQVVTFWQQAKSSSRILQRKTSVILSTMRFETGRSTKRAFSTSWTQVATNHSSWCASAQLFFFYQRKAQILSFSLRSIIRIKPLCNSWAGHSIVTYHRLCMHYNNLHNLYCSLSHKTDFMHVGWQSVDWILLRIKTGCEFPPPLPPRDESSIKSH
jgi:hypothetical protein